MQLALNQERYLLKSKVINKVPDLYITDRDLNILRFICAMRFASLEDIHKLFFKTLRAGGESKSSWWARERLAALVDNQLLTRIYSFYERKSYYLGTMKAFLVIQKRCPQVQPVRPLEKIYFNTFEHDKIVLQIRTMFESNGEIILWKSDRELFQYPELCQGIEKVNQPDAIYKTKSGEKVAFELEIATKAKSRYQDKIKRYLHLLRSSKADKPFEKVEYVCAKEGVFKLLKEETKIYGNLFSVRRLDEYLNQQPQLIK